MPTIAALGNATPSANTNTRTLNGNSNTSGRSVAVAAAALNVLTAIVPTSMPTAAPRTARTAVSAST